MAMGLTGEQSRSSLRFSTGKQNTVEDIDRAIAALPDAVRRLREASPFYRPAASTARVRE
jgi:cysteine desulfurase